jgi:1-acyl-sn-glycerol-3-phosphate acyltransferase
MNGSIFYRFSRFVTWLFLKAGWRVEAIDNENIPPTGPVIIAANHKSFADPPVVGVSIPRAAHFLAKEELFRFRPFGWLIRRLNAHPLNRRGDVGALRDAARILQEGSVLILFPEGTRHRTGGFGKARPGVGMLAMNAGCPVVPAYVKNTALMKSFKKITVRFGRPIRPEGFGSYQALADEVMRQVQLLGEKI